ncbi:MAG: hypothetical protein HY904_19455 [Deltaproteobacteria bacterium]|nr:hypothetical protein [Deltaproteobacteria bacterium]
MRVSAKWFLAAGLPLLAACGDAPDLPLGARELEEFFRHSDWRPRADARVDVTQAPPSRVERYAVSTVVGEVKVIEGDSTNVSTITTQGNSGYGLRMDQGKQDLPRITRQVIEEEGDHFDFVVVFPAFEDLSNPGFAYFSTIKAEERGTGQDPVDLSDFFGSTGRLQGFLNMNHPAAYAQVDGLPITDETSAAYPIMGQELTHRWLAFAKVKKDGLDSGQVSDVLLGRDQAHWSALMHTGPADMSGDVYTSVQDGIAWRDNGNGTFTAAEVFSDQQFNISQKSRFSTLDLYLMGLHAPEEVDPFYVITGARYGGQAVTATSVLRRGLTVTGTRVDLTVDHVIAALGPRVPSSETTQKDFNVALVVITQPGQTAADAQQLAEQVDAFRLTWERKFGEWTGGRASVCTALSGNCATARLKVSAPRVTGAAAAEPVLPGRDLPVEVTVENTGSADSLPAMLALAAETGVVTPAQVALPALAAGTMSTLAFTVTPADTLACGSVLTLTATLTTDGPRPITQSARLPVGLRTVGSDALESLPGWTVNPDGTDSAVHGAWAWGVPQLTDLRRYGATQVIGQPGDDVTPDGSHGFFTDPGAAGADPEQVGATDVDDGTTTLETTPLDLAGLVDPVVRWKSWHSAFVVDVQAGELRDGTGDDLVTLLRVDDGAWTEVDRDASNDFQWKDKAIRLADVAGVTAGAAHKVKLRFVIGDLGDEQNIVEAGIDELSITDVAAGCPGTTTNPGSGTDTPGGNPGDGDGTGSGGDAPGGAPAQGCTCAVPAATPSLSGIVMLALLRSACRRRSARRVEAQGPLR